jgi:hypothetical protein
MWVAEPERRERAFIEASRPGDVGDPYRDVVEHVREANRRWRRFERRRPPRAVSTQQLGWLDPGDGERGAASI